MMRRLLGVSPSGFYAWARRQPSQRALANARLAEEIRAAHTDSKGTYGAPRIQVELAERGVRASRKRIARLMHAQGLSGVSRRRGVRTTVRDGARQAPDLVDRNFTAEAPNRLWVADITYVPTWAGFLYLAVALDVFSRRIVGWSMATTLKTKLVLDALDMALWRRRPQAVIHHSDQGSQYTSIGFGNRCREAGVRPSMGSVGDCYDNAMCESFFATLECELLDRTRFSTHAEARIAIFEFIEGFYNPRRRHSGVSYLAPAEFEKWWAERTAASAQLALDPGAPKHAGVLTAVKNEPWRVAAEEAAILDRRSARRRHDLVGRDEKMLQAELKDGHQKEDNRTSNAAP
jgi:putative transposase